MKRFKIVFLSRWIPPKIDGIGDYTWNLVRALRERNIDAELVTSRGQESRDPWAHPLIERWETKFLVKALKNFQRDWICLQYAPPLYGKYGICPQLVDAISFLHEKLKQRIAITFHELTVEKSLNPKTLFLKWILDKQNAKLMKSCDVAIGTCGRHLPLFTPLESGTPFKIIPVGTNVLMQKASGNELEDLRQKYRVQGAKIWTIFGRLSGFRNFQMTLRVLQEARRRSVPVFLMLLGCIRSSNAYLFRAFMSEARQRGVEKYLIETGDLDESKISHHLQITDLFLFPQIDGVSTRSTTVMSAMEHGLPIIAYEPVPGNYDDYQLPYGAWVPRGDEDAFTQKAIEFTVSGIRWPSVLCQKQYFADHFSWERIATEYEKVLNA